MARENIPIDVLIGFKTSKVFLIGTKIEAGAITADAKTMVND